MDEGAVGVIVELNNVSPVVVSKIGESGELLRVVVKVTEYEDGVFDEGPGVFDDVVHSVNVLGTFCSDGV